MINPIITSDPIIVKIIVIIVFKPFCILLYLLCYLYCGPHLSASDIQGFTEQLKQIIHLTQVNLTDGVSTGWLV